MVAEEVVVSLCGGAPWGFRLQGGAEHQRPLQVAKVRRRSKACRAGLKEEDELLAIDECVCAEFSHAQAMSLIDSHRSTLNLRVKRVLSPPLAPVPPGRPSVLSPTGGPGCLTSPPDSEAYYGETDSDADTHMHTHRRQRRTPPHARSPGRHDNQQEEETSEMSGYESAPDGSLHAQWDGGLEPACPHTGVPRREVVFQPSLTDWTPPYHPPTHTLSQLQEPAEMVGGVEGEGEGDSGFQEVGGCAGLSCPPLVSPQRAKEAMAMRSSGQLVPMVGPQENPLNDELSTTYKEKARQAKLQRGDSVVEKQVKEARSKCRSIASLLTHAPDPHSKGVLMFKKRRQRAKKYTLTCFGRAEGDTGGETEGEMTGEEEEGSSFPSGSEVDEEGFSGAYDPTWDSGYLDLLDRRSSACPSTTPTNHSPGLENTTYHSPGLENSTSTYESPGLNNSNYQSPGLNNSTYDSPGLNNSTYQSPGLDDGSKKQPVRPSPASNSSPRSPPAVSLANGAPLDMNRTSMVLIPQPSDPNSNPNINPDPNPNMNFNPNPGGVLNRTARPFTPGLPPPRTPATPVCFRPPQPAPLTKPKPVSMVNKPTSAISMVTIPAPRSASGPEVRRAVSSTSLYIPPRPNTSVFSPPPLLSPPPHLSPPSLAPTSLPSGCPAQYSPSSSVLATPFSPHPMPLSPSLCPPPVCLSSTVICQPSSPPSAPPIPASSPACPLSPQHQPAPVQYPQPLPPGPAHHPPPPFLNPYMSAPGGQALPAHMVSSTLPPSSDSLESREQRISVPASRTGILQDARRRSNKKPMFSTVEEKKAVSPNPALLSLLQNQQPEASPGAGVPGAGGPGGTAMEAGMESGPEEDWLKLGAEACNFLQAQRGPKPPPVAPKPHVQQQVPQLEGKGGQLFARRQSRMDRFVVDRTPGTPRPSPTSPREPSPTPSLPATWKYSSSIRAPPPINYNPLLSPSLPSPAHKSKGAEKKPGQKKAGIKAVDIMSHQPYQLNSSLFSYGGPQKQSGPGGGPQVPKKTARVQEIRRFSTPPPSGPVLKIIAPRSATTLGEPFWRSDVISPPPIPTPVLQPYQPKPASTPYQPQVQPASPLYQPQPQHASTPYQPQVQPASTPYQPQAQPASPLYQPQPQHASSPYQPQHASSPYQPHHASSPYQPHHASSPYQPQLQPASSPYQPQHASTQFQPQVHRASLHLSPPPPPTTPLPLLPKFSPGRAPNPLPPPAPCGSPSSPSQATRQSKSAPDLSPLSLACARPPSSTSQPASGPRPRFSTSTLGLQPHIWRPGSTLY